MNEFNTLKGQDILSYLKLVMNEFSNLNVKIYQAI